jgi:dienelactone hydrolase|tara:strand:- start:1393 stop:2223 length:831 start_codon:yes stop_codon:yes gene_type:complete
VACYLVKSYVQNNPSVSGAVIMVKCFSYRLIATLIATLISTLYVFAGAHANASELHYSVGGQDFKAHVSQPAGKSLGKVFIIHDWDGLNQYEKKRADMLAELGYEAVALDLFGVDAKLEGFEDYKRETGALYQNRSEFQSRIAAAVKAASANSKSDVAEFLIGYCFGGAAVLEGARMGLDVDGFVSFHGGLETPEGQDYSQTKGAVLLLHGSADPVSGMDALASTLQQMQKAEITHSAEVYGGARHSFTVQGSRDYNADADEKSWQALLRFLETKQ